MKVGYGPISQMKPGNSVLRRQIQQPRFGNNQPKQEPPEIPMWEAEDDKGIKAKCTYNPDNFSFTVTVGKGDIQHQESFPSTYTPAFGMDVEDHAQMLEIAEKLAQKVEEDLNKPKS